MGNTLKLTCRVELLLATSIRFAEFPVGKTRGTELASAASLSTPLYGSFTLSSLSCGAELLKSVNHICVVPIRLDNEKKNQ